MPSFLSSYFGSYYRVHSPERTRANIFQLESIKAIANLSGELAHWGFVRRGAGVVSDGQVLYIP